MQLSFLGAAGTVTGSKYLLTLGNHRCLIDCGLFQGQKALRLRNWDPLPADPKTIDAVVLTHAHLDHSGYLPLLVKNGFKGPILCSHSTANLAEILLIDSGHIQEKDAEFANRRGYSKHKPALPLYTQLDAERTLPLFVSVPFAASHKVFDGLQVTFRRAGHILGAASVELKAENTTLVFSGDIGRYGDPIFADPEPVRSADYLVVESTYGNRKHENVDAGAVLGRVISRTIRRGGTVIIPAFAVGRAQSLLFHLHQLKMAGELQRVPVFLDSPMALDASEIFCNNINDHKLSEHECRSACGVATYVRSVEDSKKLTADPIPKVIISASGMATGGRVLHHLKRYAPDEQNTILFAGFQAAGTRGAAMVAGAKTVRIHGEDIEVRAEVSNLSMLSAHADADDIMRWLRNFQRGPRLTFVTHGDTSAAEALKTRIEAELGWHCRVPAHLETFKA